MEIPLILLHTLIKLPQPTLVGVSGFGGAGKSTFAKELGVRFGAPVVGVDSFQTKGAFTTEFELWNIMDFARLEREVLRPFLAGDEYIHYGQFDPTPERIVETVSFKNTGKVIVEGVGLLRPELLPFFSYTIWVDCPMDVAIARGKWRDREVYHNPTDELWDGVWKRNDQQCFDRYHPLENADYIVKNE